MKRTEFCTASDTPVKFSHHPILEDQTAIVDGKAIRYLLSLPQDLRDHEFMGATPEEINIKPGNVLLGNSIPIVPLVDFQ